MRGKLILFATFCLLFIWRWVGLESPLPKTWTPDSKIRYTARVLEEIEQTDSKTIVRDGVFRITFKGYVPLEMGREYAFAGTVVPRVILGKIVQIEMVDPTFEEVKGSGPNLGEKAILSIVMMRRKMVASLQRWLPEPYSSLAAGILLGVKRNMPWEFYQQIVSKGTLHIVAASGYNVMVVARVLMGLVLLVLSRKWAIAVGVVGIVVYVVLAGASAAVVRAGVMGSLTLVAYYWGRPAEAKRLLWVTAGLMLLAQPRMLVDVGFQLSVAATAGLLYIEPVLRRKFEKRMKEGAIREYLAEYWWPTVAATLATAPVIWLTFGRLSLISPVVNIIVLPLTPLIMFMTSVAVGAGTLLPVLGQGVSYLLYVPLWVMVEVIRLFG